VGLALFGWLLVSRDPWLVRPLSVALRYSFTLVAPGLLLVVYLVLRLPERWGRWLRFPLCMAPFALCLAGLWASGQSELYVISGLLPWTDARNYYLDAQRLLNGALFSTFSARRPMFAGLLATLLALTGNNLQLAVALLVLLTGAACYLLANEVRRSHGAAPAALVWLLVFLFYRRFSGTTMTENLGLALGAAGLALLWRGAGVRRLWLVVLGALVLTLALNARAGTFFVLPALVLWAGWQWRGERRFGWRAAGWVAAAVALGFACNLLLFRLLAPDEGAVFGNFAHSLYGLVTGGEGWGQIRRDHPEVMDLPEAERSSWIYYYAWQEVRRNPLGLVRGVLLQWQLLFSGGGYGLYSFVGGENEGVRLAAVWGCYLAAAGGGVWLAGQRRQPWAQLAAALALGVLASAPFVPPGDALQLRAYAATVPVIALLPGLGLAALLSVTGRLPGVAWLGGRAAEDEGDFGPAVFAAGLALLAVLGPLGVRALAHPAQTVTLDCPAGMQAVYFWLPEGSAVQVIKEDVLQLDWLPEFHQGRFRLRVHNITDVRAAGELERVEAPATVFPALELRSNQDLWLVVDRDLLPDGGGLRAACGRYSENPGVQAYGFFYPERVR